MISTTSQNDKLLYIPDHLKDPKLISLYTDGEIRFWAGNDDAKLGWTKLYPVVSESK